MKFLTFVLFILTVYKANSTDYCDIQLKLCENKKHVACVIDSFHNKSFLMEVMKNEIKSMILGKFNDARNKIATNNGNNNNSLTIPHMMILNWKEELENLAAFYIQSTYENNDNNLCYLTLEGNKPFVTKYVISNEYQPFTELQLILQMTEKMISIYASNELKNSTFFDPSSKSVGCTLAYIQRNETLKVILQCIFDVPKEKLTEKIMGGLPCSKCDIWGVKCNKEYTGLCGLTKYELIEDLKNLHPKKSDGEDTTTFVYRTGTVWKSMQDHYYKWIILTLAITFLILIIIGYLGVNLVDCYNIFCICCRVEVALKRKGKKIDRKMFV